MMKRPPEVETELSTCRVSSGDSRMSRWSPGQSQLTMKTMNTGQSSRLTMNTGQSQLTMATAVSQRTSPTRAISVVRMNVEEHAEVPFDPEAEKRPGVLRKRVLPHSTIGWTDNCVVTDQSRLPDYLFTNLSLVDEKGKLVTQFYYTGTENGQSPEIHYDIDEVWSRHNQDNLDYTQVLTKNSHWDALLKTLVMAGMLFAMTEYSHFVFISWMKRLNDAGGKEHTVLDLSYRSAMFIVLGVSYGLRVSAAVHSAKLEWGAQKYSPDIVTQSYWRWPPHHEGQEEKPPVRRLRWFDKIRAFLAIVVFQLTGVPGVLRDITTFLHPWKGVQGFAAFKMDGARAYLLSFPSPELYRIENWPRHEVRYALTFAQTFVMTALKVKFYVDAEKFSSTWNSDMTYFVIAVVPGFFTMIISFFGWISLAVTKRNCRAWLEKQLESADPTQQQVAQRLLQKHFGKESKDNRQSGNNYNAQVEGKKDSRAKHCAEIARELQLWKVGEKLEDELAGYGIEPEMVDKILWAIRDIAKDSITENELRRGPKHDASDTFSIDD